MCWVASCKLCLRFIRSTWYRCTLMSWGVCIWGTCCDNSHSDASLECSDSRLDHGLRTQVWRLSTAISMYLLVRTNYFVVIVFSSIHEAFYMQRIITSNSSRYWELPDSNDGVRTEAPASEKGVHSDDWISSVYRSCLTTNTVSEGWVCYTMWSIKYHFWPRHRTWGWAACGLLATCLIWMYWHSVFCLIVLHVTCYLYITFVLWLYAVTSSVGCVASSSMLCLHGHSATN